MNSPKFGSIIFWVRFTDGKEKSCDLDGRLGRLRESEGYVFKKLAAEISSDEKIISEKEYMKISGLTSYEKKFGHGGARENAGRKQKLALPLKFQIRVTKEEKDFILYAREHNLNYATLMQM